MKNILLIEDEAFYSDIAKHTFKNEGFHFAVANTPSSAMELLSTSTSYDMVLCDISLEDNFDGIEIADFIFKQFKIPIIFLSSYTEKSYVEKTQIVPSYGFIDKSSGFPILISTVKMAFRLIESNEKLAFSEARLKEAQSVSQTGNWVLDIEKNRLHWSKEIFNIFEINEENFGGTYEAFLSKVHPDDREAVNKTYTNSIQTRLPYDITHRLLMQDGRIKYVKEKCETFYSEGRPIRSIGTVQDISKEMKTEKRLKYWENIFRNSKLGIAIGSESSDVFELTNREFDEMHGYNFGELLGMPILMLTAPEFLDTMRSNIFRAIDCGHFSWESIHLRKDGTRFPVLIDVTVIKNKNGKPDYKIMNILNLTHQKQLSFELEKAKEMIEKSEIQFRTIADFTSDWIYWLSANDSYIYISPSVEKITGYSPEEFKNTAGLMYKIIHPDDIFLFQNHEKFIKSVRKLDSLDFRIITKSGDIRWINHLCQPIYNSNGIYEGIRGSNREITERKVSEEKVKALLSEKESILKEVHHRIKNNMNGLISLLMLKINSLQNEEIKSALEEVQSLIYSMMTLYEKLFQSEDSISTSLKGYLIPLINHIVETYPGNAKIRVDVQICDVMLDSKKLTSLGIITNEFITNSIKYAFPHKQNGKIKVSSEIKGDSISDQYITIKFEDDGIGYPDSVSLNNTSGFGMELISLMVKQLKGNVCIDRNHGSSISIRFKI